MALVKYNNNSISAVTSAASIPSGAMTHIKTLTASSSATLSFVDGSSDVVLDSTYPIYVFKFINVHASQNETWFQFQGSVDGGSNYNVSATTTNFVAHNRESGGNQGLNYYDSRDSANSTGYIYIAGWEQGIDNDQSISGSITIFNPSDTTFVKHFISKCNISHPSDFTANGYMGGYFNTTSAINSILFKMTSGNIDSGKIKLYGIKDS